MHYLIQHHTRALCGLLIIWLLVACGGVGDTPAAEVERQAGMGAAAGKPVDTEEAAVAAVHAHLFQITSCRTASDRLEADFAGGSFDARLTSAYSIRSQNPVWEVGFAGDLHIPYVIWFVEQSDGTVLASISAATYYESPLIHMCHQI